MGENLKKLGKDIIKVEDGKVIIESEEIAKAIQDGNLDLLVDEEHGWGDTNMIC